MLKVLRLQLAAVLLLLSTSVLAAKKIDVDFFVRFLPATQEAEVRLTLAKGELIQSVKFYLPDPEHYFAFNADGQWHEEGNGYATWTPVSGKASLTYRVRINQREASGAYSAMITDDWALLRGDDLIPAVDLRAADKLELVSRLQFALPEGWRSVETGWPRIGKNRFRINNPRQVFDRPTGWILAGKIGTRRTRLGETDVTIAAPIGSGMHRMDVLTLLTFVWPHAQAVFPRDPRKLLLVGAADPMWRGGLSAPNSLFMHAERPLVSENGTSSLLHELVHVLSRIRDTDNSDWISEGIAEYYAIELLRRAGGMSEERYQQVRKKLTLWSSKVNNLRGENCKGPVTARAVVLLQELDQEIRQRSGGKHSLDDVVQGLMRMDKVSTEDFIELSESLIGKPSKVLDTKLLRLSKAKPAA
jgi:predicted metalloprotease with PDZ domain